MASLLILVLEAFRQGMVKVDERIMGFFDHVLG